MRLYRIFIFLTSFMITFPCYANDLTYHTLLTALMKLTPSFDYENYASGYMQTFRPQIWQQAHDDEFQMHNEEASTIQIMKSDVAAFNLNDPITIRTDAQFGEYNFSTHAYAFSPFDEGTYFPVSQCCSTLPNEIHLYLSNPQVFNGLPMSESAAEEFLEAHKHYGLVNRILEVEMDVKILRLKDDNDLLGKIVKFTIYDSDNKSIVQSESIKDGQ